MGQRPLWCGSLSLTREKDLKRSFSCGYSWLYHVYINKGKGLVTGMSIVQKIHLYIYVFFFNFDLPKSAFCAHAHLAPLSSMTCNGFCVLCTVCSSCHCSCHCFSGLTTLWGKDLCFIIGFSATKMYSRIGMRFRKDADQVWERMN